MALLVGAQFVIELPKKVLDLIGDIEGADVIVDVLNLFIDSISDEEKKKWKEAVPQVSKAMFISTIISTMVENDITFAQSQNLSKNQMKQVVEQFKQILEMVNEEEDIKEMFSAMMSEIIRMAQDIAVDMKSNDDDGNKTFEVTLSKMTPAFYNSLIKVDLVSLAEKIGENQNVKSKINNNIITPLKNAIIDVVKKIQEREFMSDEDMEELFLQFEKSFDVFYVSFPLQAILSVILTKAIDENISFSEASTELEFDIIFEHVNKQITQFDKVPKIVEGLKNLLDMMFRLNDM